MEMKVLWAGAMLFGGWLWFFLFVRQFLFNLTVAYPMIKSMKKASEDLIHDSATKYTTTSMIICTVFIAIVIFVVLRFAKPYLIISFFVGALVCLLILLNKFTPKCRQMFDSFCGTYYQFVPDDELRTAMFNKKTSQMKKRLHAMGVSTEFIPEFTK